MKKSPVLSILLILGFTFVATAQLQLLSHDPVANQGNAVPNSNIVLTFDATIDAATLDAASVVITGSQKGKVEGVFSGGGTSVITFDPVNDFHAGETITVTITRELKSEAGDPMIEPYTFSFRTISAPSPETPSVFTDIEVGMANNFFSVYPADIDGDGDMDLLGASGSDDRITWYENIGGENFNSHDIASPALGNPVDFGHSVFAADVDSDGDMDVLSASFSDDRIVWYENDGTESFTTHEVSNTADGTRSIHAVDIDGDGDIDILSASQFDNRVTKYVNDGSQNFTIQDVDGALSQAYAVTAADVDSDGSMDVLVGSWDGDLVWYDSEGTRHTIPNTLGSITQVHADDLDEDGDVDVIVSYFNNDRISWYENDGFQTFTEHEIASFSNGNKADGATSVHTGDLDGDGDVDVLSSSQNDDRVVWYENDGNEGFTTHNITDTEDSPQSVYAVDMDGDGDLDVVVGSGGSSDRILWFKNAERPPVIQNHMPIQNGQSVDLASNIVLTFDATIDAATLDETSVEITGSQTGKIAGVFSGGGTSIVAFNPTNDFHAGETITVTITRELKSEAGVPMSKPYTYSFRTASAPSPETPSVFTDIEVGMANNISSVYPADIDGDGDMDLLGTSVSDDRVIWFENIGDENFNSHDIASPALGNPVDFGHSVFAADVDSDGDMDVLSASFSDDRIVWYENDGTESFTTHEVSNTADGARTVYSADLDADGDMDILSASEFDNRITKYVNDGSQNFTAQDIDGALSRAYTVTAADVDSDGSMDVLAGSWDGDLVWYDNDGTRHTIPNTLGSITQVHADDLDGDGDMDIVVSYFNNDRISWYENDGFQTFTEHEIASFSNGNKADGATSVHTGDLDGDGDVDVLSSSQNDDRVVWYENDGHEGFTTHNITDTEDSPQSVYAVDMDGDGDLDVVVGSGGSSDRIVWFKNADLTSPEVTISTTADSPTNDYAIPVTIAFTEEVNGFELSDVTITNGEGSGFIDNGSGNYSVTVTAIADGAVTVSVAGGASMDADGNLNTASNTLEINYDGTAPSVTISTTAENPTNHAAIPVTITFTEEVNGFDLADVTITNGTGSGFLDSGSGYYSLTVMAIADGAVMVSVPADASSDAAGNANIASNTLEIDYDGIAPGVTVSTIADSPTNQEIPVTIAFTEEVEGFELSDVAITNGEGADFMDNGLGHYSLTVTAIADGAVSVSVAADESSDAAGNANTASNTLEIDYDGTAPGVTISTTAENPTNVAAIPVTITFTEEVDGFELSDVTITNGDGSGFIDNGSGHYSLTVTAIADGAVTVSVSAAVSSDVAGNVNSASNFLEVDYSLNSAPELHTIIPDQSIGTSESKTIALGDHFVDSNGDVLDYTVENEDNSVATINLENDNLLIQGIAEGISEVKLTADDQKGGTMTAEFTITVSRILSIDYDMEVEYYPNPVVSSLFINVEKFKISRWHLFNNLGQLEAQGNINDEQLELDISSYPEGIYFLKLTSSKGYERTLRVQVKRQ